MRDASFTADNRLPATWDPSRPTADCTPFALAIDFRRHFVDGWPRASPGNPLRRSGLHRYGNHYITAATAIGQEPRRQIQAHTCQGCKTMVQARDADQRCA